jgi:PAS domain S-box-containing protein
MSFEYSPYILPLIAAAVISSWVAVYSWSRRSTVSAIALSVMAITIAEWSLGYALEIAGADLATKLFWGKIQYFGIALAPLTWLLFGAIHSNRGKDLTPRAVALLAVIPVITILLALTTESNHLIWTDYHIARSNGFSALEVSHGPWFWVHSVYSYVLLMVGTFIIILRSIWRKQGLYRRQAAALLIAVLAPWAGNILYLFGLSPIPHLDLTPFAFTITIVALAWGVLGFQLIDLVPIARSTVVEEMNDGVIVIDSQGRLVDINPAAQKLINLSTSQALGRPAAEVFSPWAELAQKYRNVMDAMDEIEIGAGESQRWFELRLSALYDRRKRFAGRVITIRDITARKQAQAALATARDQALEASLLKSQLLASVSHELRTPLSGILGYAELLQIESFGPLAPEQKKAAAQIVEGADYLAAMINGLLDEAQIEAKTLILKMGRCSPREILTRAEASMVVLARNKGLGLLTDVDPGFPAQMAGDEQRLQQIFTNLIGNAIKFTKEGQVRATLSQPDPEHWCFQVMDTGVGIPREDQSRIFEPFQKLNNSLTRENRGTGLGLSITRQLVDLMGGEIDVESEVGLGSRFTVTLPLLDAPEGGRKAVNSRYFAGSIPTSQA